MIELTLSEALAQLNNGAVTAVALTQAYLDRIRQVEPQVRAFLTVTAEQALEQAAAADQRRANGEVGPESGPESGPLLGVPLAIKDVLATQGIPTTAGSRILEGFRPPYNATVVQKLADAGAVVLGKTNTDEFAMGSSTENSGYFTTHNPWDLDRVPGGSSGGSAAAVVARMAPAALGTDTGGSVRQPASLCGVVGLKPSYGRVSRFGLIAYASSLDQVGTLTRTVRDAALLMNVIAGHDPRDSTSMPQPAPDYVAALNSSGDLKGLRVGLPREYFTEGIQPAVAAAVRAAVDQLAALGAEVIEVSLPHTPYGLPVYYLVATAEASANLARFDGVRYGQREDRGEMWPTYKATRGGRFGDEVKRRIMLGTYALSAGYYDAYYGKAQQVRTLIREDFDRAFQQVDVLAVPTSPTTAFKIGEKADDPLQMYLSDVYTITANLAGIPGLSLPCGFDEAGLPIGLQLLGPAFQEERLLRMGHVYETATDWHRRSPALA